MKINLAIPNSLGGGTMSGDCFNSAFNQFLGRFSADDVATFAAGYAQHVTGKRMAMAVPQTATVTAQRAPQPQKGQQAMKPTTTLSQPVYTTALAHIEAIARKIAVDEGLTHAQAIEQAAMRNPDLYLKYVEEMHR